MHDFYSFQPPLVLRPSEDRSENEAIEIAITKLLLRSYYDIVRKNVEDSVPKAIMHFLVSLKLNRFSTFPCAFFAILSMFTAKFVITMKF